MIISDFHVIGNKLLQFRKKVHLTQIEVAELAGLSDRTYADIERGNVNMRLDTLLRICTRIYRQYVFHNEIFVNVNIPSGWL